MTCWSQILASSVRPCFSKAFLPDGGTSDAVDPRFEARLWPQCKGAVSEFAVTVRQHAIAARDGSHVNRRCQGRSETTVSRGEMTRFFRPSAEAGALRRWSTSILVTGGSDL